MTTTSKPAHDPVKSPAHYTAYPVQPIEITRHLGFCLGNAVKYVLRAPFKGGVEDCEKALQYLEWEAETPQKLTFYAFSELSNAIQELNKHIYASDRNLALCYLQGAFLLRILPYTRGIWLKSGPDFEAAKYFYGEMISLVKQMIEILEVKP